MLCGLCYLMFFSRRQVTMFVLICSIILNRLLCELIRIYLNCKVEEITKILVNKVSSILIVIFVITLSFYMVKDKFDDTYVDETITPYTTTSAIRMGLGIGMGSLAIVFFVIYIVY